MHVFDLVIFLKLALPTAVYFVVLTFPFPVCSAEGSQINGSNFSRKLGAVRNLGGFSVILLQCRIISCLTKYWLLDDLVAFWVFPFLYQI